MNFSIFGLLYCYCLIILMGPNPRPSLYVFLPSDKRPHVMQDILQKACPELEITVFGRFREFEKQVSENPPDAVLAPAVSIAEIADYLPVFLGKRESAGEEKYVFLSVDKALDVKDLPNATLGTVDVMGRTRLQSFLSAKLGISKVKLRTVTKLEDLLSLLHFQDVNAIIVPVSKIPYYRDRSRLNLITTDLQGIDIRIGLPILAIRSSSANAAAAEMVKANLKSVGLEVNREILGVDLWVTP